MSKRTRIVAAAFGALAISAFFVTGALAAKPVPSISVTKTASPATVPAGGANVKFTIVVTNDGNSDFHGLAISDSKAACVLDKDGSDITGSNKFAQGDTYTATCTYKVTAAQTNTVTVSACTDGSVDQCNNADHLVTATASATVTVGTNTATVDMSGTSAALLALILLVIGGFGFFASTKRLPKLF